MFVDRTIKQISLAKKSNILLIVIAIIFILPCQSISPSYIPHLQQNHVYRFGSKSRIYSQYCSSSQTFFSASDMQKAKELQLKQNQIFKIQQTLNFNSTLYESIIKYIQKFLSSQTFIGYCLQFGILVSLLIVAFILCISNCCYRQNIDNNNKTNANILLMVFALIIILSIICLSSCTCLCYEVMIGNNHMRFKENICAFVNITQVIKSGGVSRDGKYWRGLLVIPTTLKSYSNQVSQINEYISALNKSMIQYAKILQKVKESHQSYSIDQKKSIIVKQRHIYQFLQIIQEMHADNNKFNEFVIFLNDKSAQLLQFADFYYKYTDQIKQNINKIDNLNAFINSKLVNSTKNEDKKRTANQYVNYVSNSDIAIKVILETFVISIILFSIVFFVYFKRQQYSKLLFRSFCIVLVIFTIIFTILCLLCTFVLPIMSWSCNFFNQMTTNQTMFLKNMKRLNEAKYSYQISKCMPFQSGYLTLNHSQSLQLLQLQSIASTLNSSIFNQMGQQQSKIKKLISSDQSKGLGINYDLYQALSNLMKKNVDIYSDVKKKLFSVYEQFFDEKYGFLDSLNCRVFGDNVKYFIDGACTSLYLYIHYIRRYSGIIAYLCVFLMIILQILQKNILIQQKNIKNSNQSPSKTECQNPEIST